jgi:hypothetical protein
MIPFWIASAVIGLGAHASASSDNSEARSKNEQANKIIEEAAQITTNAKQQCQHSMDKLATEKALVLKGNMNRFVRNFSKIKAVNFSGSDELFEIERFNKNELTAMQAMIKNVQEMSINNVIGGISGSMLAVGAADVLFGGTLLSEVSISASGLAGGVFLGRIAAPVFAISGVFSACEAVENLEKAKSNLAKAISYQDECKTYFLLTNAVSERCDLFYEVLYNIDSNWFTYAVDQLENLVNSKKTVVNCSKNISKKNIYTRGEMQTLASVVSLAKMIKVIIDTNILDQDGHVTDESVRVIKRIQEKLGS